MNAATVWTDVLLLMVGIYFVPTIIAAARGLRNRGSIIVLNIFLGWSLVGWVVALCWSVSGTAQTDTQERG